ncbi:MAG: ATP-binding protein [Neomegalonema sp.]|nr:ATP-binding protein [Neomegalonema sp.]
MRMEPGQEGQNAASPRSGEKADPKAGLDVCGESAQQMTFAFTAPPERRRYNRWVADETLEDFALRFTARRARRWSMARVANTAIGSISFLALEAIGGAITLSYGFETAVTAILLVGMVLFLTAFPISYYAARYGVDIDLLTRGAGFGYIGSTLTSLIYASFTFIFFALEAAILSLALEYCFGIPLALGYILNALVVIPLVTHGFTKISIFQAWTQPFWIVLHLLPFVMLGFSGYDLERWTGFEGAAGQGLSVLTLGAALGVVASLIAQIGEQVDFLRFLPEPKTARERRNWWLALIAAGPGWAVLGVLKMLAGSYLATLALGAGASIEAAGDPTRMYASAFASVFDHPAIVLTLTGGFVLLSQLKINVTNAYAGSIAWSNFFSRLTHSHPGRVVWLVFNVAIALMLMELGVFGALESTLALYSHVALAWIGALVADLVINKPLGLSPPGIEFRRAHLYDINPVGLGAMSGACLLVILAGLGLFGPSAAALTPVIALGASLILAPLIAYVSGGRYYIARPAAQAPAALHVCSVCEYRFDPEDITHCPFYSGPICSLCCSLDSRCRDACKPEARIARQASRWLDTYLPAPLKAAVTSRFGKFALLGGLLAMVFGGVLWLVSRSAASPHFEAHLAVIFAAGLFVIGVLSWMFVLAAESQAQARDEAEIQTQRLLREIRAHERTDRQLQEARDKAEAANLAKTRYMAGLSHELRTPLNSIFGFAQILENDPATPAHRREAVSTIRRSSEHLAGLIEGLLDISKIEAGRLEINRDRVNLRLFLNQIANIFEERARLEGIDFSVSLASNLPEWVAVDEKRLRQIIINLLSNAMRYTEKGSVSLSITYRSEVAEILVADTGCGIAPEDLERIWQPFERGGNAAIAGSGLGLTITKLLVNILGGDIEVTSTLGQGSAFRVRLMLPSLGGQGPRSALEQSTARILGYRGRRRVILVVDDDLNHLRMIESTLTPLGFEVYRASGAEEARLLLGAVQPDLFLLDIDMPGASGWDLAAHLRQNGYRSTPVVMVSGHALEARTRGPENLLHDAFIVKPVNLEDLTERIRQLLGLEWVMGPSAVPARATDRAVAARQLNAGQARQLLGLAELGLAGELRKSFDAIEADEPDLREALAPLRARLSVFDLPAIVRLLAPFALKQTAPGKAEQRPANEPLSVKEGEAG